MYIAAKANLEKLDFLACMGRGIYHLTHQLSAAFAAAQIKAYFKKFSVMWQKLKRA